MEFDIARPLVPQPFWPNMADFVGYLPAHGTFQGAKFHAVVNGSGVGPQILLWEFRDVARMAVAGVPPLPPHETLSWSSFPSVTIPSEWMLKQDQRHARAAVGRLRQQVLTHSTRLNSRRYTVGSKCLTP